MKRFYKNEIAMKTYSLISVMVFLCGCISAFNSSSGQPGRYSHDHSLVKDILEPINETRSKGMMCGNRYYKPARPVVWNDTLGQAALQHSLDMAEKGFLSHKGSDRSDLGERLSRVGYQWISYGENVGQGYRTAQDAVSAWLKSEIHCKNIMNPEFKEAGASYAKSSNRRSYWTLILGNPKQQ
jgi:uncharacterized protein YkwD